MIVITKSPTKDKMNENIHGVDYFTIFMFITTSFPGLFPLTELLKYDFFESIRALNVNGFSW